MGSLRGLRNCQKTCVHYNLLYTEVFLRSRRDGVYGVSIAVGVSVQAASLPWSASAGRIDGASGDNEELEDAGAERLAAVTTSNNVA